MKKKVVGSEDLLKEEGSVECCRNGSEEDSSPRTRQCSRRITSSSGSGGSNNINNNNTSGSANEEIVQPEVVAAGLNNLLEQLTTKHKQNYRTDSCPEDDEEDSVVMEQEVNRRKWWSSSWWGESECHHQQQQRNSRIPVVAAAAGRAESSVLRPAKLAWLLMISALLFSVLVVPGAVVQGDEIKTSQVAKHRPAVVGRGDGICGSVDVRNSPTHLDRLKDCVIVEGFVHILLIDKYTEAAFDNYSFPLLTEITEYLLLFRVNGLRSLRKLFPNLSVIRGDVLVGDYAMVVYELMHIEELALVSLSAITRGGVRIEKNPKLCYSDTIDWKAITVPGTNNYIKENQVDNNCPMCPTETSLILPNGTRYMQKCPLALTKGGIHKEFKETLCWNANHCQNICPENCPNKSCTSLGTCCHESCIGGCTGPNGNECTVCRHLSIDPSGKRQCVAKCPEGMYRFHTRCITYEECYNTRKPVMLLPDEDLPDFPYIPHNGGCVMDCPVGYETMKNETRVNNQVQSRKWCKLCAIGGCPRKCSGSNIDNTQSAQMLKGCEIITGSLEIQLRTRGGENIVKELENFLSSITEIYGYLKIVRSYPLLSLGFFRKLRVIHGQVKANNIRRPSSATLYVVENQNLQELFDHEVSIGGDRMFFYNNPMLCTDKIIALKAPNPQIMIENEEQLGLNNGDRAACQITELKTYLKLVTTDMAVVHWEKFTKLADARQLLGYVFYFIEAPYQNVTYFDGRDACNTEGWKVDDVNEGDTEPSTKILTKLKPFTQYAYYVKTWTLASEGMGGQSKIAYFKTLPSTPTVVRDLEAVVGKDTLTIRWQPPIRMNGLLRHYEIFVELNADDNEQLKARNFCDDVEKAREIIPEKPTIPPTQKTAVCTEAQCRNYCRAPSAGEPSSSSPIDITEKENQITFEDQLHNYIYIKNQVPIRNNEKKESRQKRSNHLFPLAPISEVPKKNATGTDRRTEKVPGEPFYRYMFNVTNETSFSYPLTNFNHYSLYVFKIRACRLPADPVASEVKKVENEESCGNDALESVRTPKKPGADNIPSESVLVEEQSNNTQRVIKVQWREPSKPNGPIVKFSVKYQRVDLDSVSATEKCITYGEFNNTGFAFLSKLEPGNYSIRVMATSIAGDGAYTAPRYLFLKKDDDYAKNVFLVVSLCLTFLAITAGLVWAVYRFHYAPKQIRMYPDVNPDYAGVIYKVDEWEVERHHIIQLEELGQGSFGMVYKGILTYRNGAACNIPCAIKTVNENATAREKDSFLMEASVMKQFHTHHVVQLLGVVSQGDPTLVIMELMANGDLKSYLRRHRPDYENGDEPAPQPPTLRAIMQMAIEIADGMAYLSAKKFVHRDLAARNCMVADDMTVKIGDFGMTRDIYETDYYRKGTKGFLPVRWMAPESLKDGVFSSSSDVFSYGVVLWEMATLASQPYQGLTNDQVLRYVIEGGVMERPENCPDNLYDLMRRCWQHRPTARPTFIEIIGELLPDASPKFLEVSFYNSREAQEMAPVQHQIMMDDVTTPLHPGVHDDDEEDDDREDGEEDAMHVGDVGTDDEFSMEMTNSHLVRNNGPVATIRSPHSPLSEQLGNRFNCDPLAISYHSRDIDDTIAEEEEPLEDEEEDEEDVDGNDDKVEFVSENGNGLASLAAGRSEAAAAAMKAGVLEASSRRDSRSARRFRELDHPSSSGGVNGRGKSRSVSPGNHGGGTVAHSRRPGRSGSSEVIGSSAGMQRHDYVNSSSGVMSADGTPGGGSSSSGSGIRFGGSAQAIPPPPQKKQQSYNRQPLIDFDSDPYGKEFDAISTDRSRISATGSRTNGRAVPSKWQQQQQSQDGRKESVPPRLRNGFIDSAAAAWSPPTTAGSTGDDSGNKTPFAKNP